MRVFVAGGSGAIGRRLIPQLVAAGHEVTATSRRPERAELLRALGARPAILDALDAGAVRAAVLDSAPAVVMNQLTDLPDAFEPARLGPHYERTGRLRQEGTLHLLAAAREAGASRFIFQSIAFMYRLTGPRVLDEQAPLDVEAPAPFGTAIRATLAGERLVHDADGIQEVILRYGQLYGPGTYYSRAGHFGRMARKRRLPIVGRGEGVFSFLHLDDAASSAVAALTRGAGVYNVVDDEPAPMREWVPGFCRAVGAPRPVRVPTIVARLLAGRAMANAASGSRGASNARARAELGWQPKWSSWREGFQQAEM